MIDICENCKKIKRIEIEKIGDGFYISNLWNISSCEIEGIEESFRENYLPDYDENDYILTFDVSYFPGQYGDYNVCEISPHWELDEISKKSIDFENEFNEGVKNA